MQTTENLDNELVYMIYVHHRRSTAFQRLPKMLSITPAAFCELSGFRRIHPSNGNARFQFISTPFSLSWESKLMLTRLDLSKSRLEFACAIQAAES